MSLIISRSRVRFPPSLFNLMKRKITNKQEFLNAIADLLDQVPPESPEEIDKVLAEAGIDTQALSEEIAEMLAEYGISS